MDVDVIPTKAALGAEVRCGDLRAADDSTIAALRRAWLAHLVVVVRGQRLSDADLLAFGRRFGECQISTRLPSPLANEGRVEQGGGDERYPEVTVVSNIVENGVAQGGLGDGELIWHSDMSSYDAPPNQTILYGIEVPPAGGATGFNNMYRAWETLPQPLRERVDGVSLKHDATIDAAGYVRARFRDADADPRQGPGAEHPLVRTHPETGRDCLYLGRRARSWVVGLALEDSERLLDALWAHAALPEHAWAHEWQAGDLVMWDNRCVMHRRDPFDPASRRMLHRMVVKGTKPFRAPPHSPERETGRMNVEG